jgi:methylated-DNA-[protein]-cysteine S-methyltransferase
MTDGIFATPWGILTATVGPRGLARVVFDGPPAPPLADPWAAALAAYVAGQPLPDLPVDLDGVPPFTRRVLVACRAIPFGATTTYAALARAIGAPRAARAVGQALARNPVPVAIPCHRVVGGDGRLHGFLGGEAWKRALLRHEREMSGLPPLFYASGGDAV